MKLNEMNKTKTSFSIKNKNNLSEINSINFKETLSVFGFTNEKRNPAITIKIEKDEYEFPNIKVMQKEVAKTIFTKQSGEIINLIKKSNDELKSGKQFNPSISGNNTTYNLNSKLNYLFYFT